MPYPWSGLLSAFVFVTGLVGLLGWRSASRRALCAALMLSGALLFFVAASSWLGRPEGQAMALLVLGVLPVYLLWGRR
jgi:NADH:ubiquinone oxidoreductase subunit K